MMYLNLMVSTNQKPAKVFKKTKRKEPKQNTKENSKTQGTRSRKEEHRRAIKNNQNQLKNGN